MIALFLIVIEGKHSQKKDQGALGDIILPDGFEIEIYANKANFGLIKPRSLKVVEKNGSIITYVGSGDSNDRTLRALIDRDGDNKVDEVVDVFKGQWWMVASVTVDPVRGNLITAEPNQTYLSATPTNSLSNLCFYICIRIRIDIFVRETRMSRS